MSWLWFVGPVVVLFIGLVVSLWPTAEERRLRRVVQHWSDELLGPLVVGNKTKSRRVRRVPPSFNSLLAEAGGGTRMTDIVLLPKLAYVAVRVADAWACSNHVTVLCRLANAAPSFCVRPLPVVDGRPIENAGIQFSQDEEFTDTFLVEGADPKAVRKWLDENVREDLMDLPNVWLRVTGKQLALSTYGAADGEALDELVGVADSIFADKGAAGGDSLFGESDSPARKPATKAQQPATYRTKPKPSAESAEEGAGEDLEPARLDLRLMAGAIDWLLYGFGALAIAAMLGVFDAFHPPALFNSPDFDVTEAWQGGWRTKGFGAFVAAETLLVLLFAYQGYLAAHHGQSIGKRLVGLRMVRTDGGPMNFFRGVLLRSWLLGAIPLVVAGLMTIRAGAFTARSFFETIPRMTTAAVGAGVLALVCASLILSASRRGLHDRLSGIQVVTAPRLRLGTIQLGVAQADPVVTRRLKQGLAVILVFVVINAVAFSTDTFFPVY